MTDMTEMTEMTDSKSLGVPSRVHRQTASESTYFAIRDMIARGELKPGSPLTIRTLAAKLNVSRTPVVEALRQLEGDGLVDIVPKWGATVKEWSLETVIEAYHIRRALESEAAELFVTRATPEDRQKLADLNTAFNQHTTTSQDHTAEIDMAFHLHVARSTRFPRLCELIENSNVERTAMLGSILIREGAGIPVNYPLRLGVHDELVRGPSGAGTRGGAAGNGAARHRGVGEAAG